MSIAIIQRMMHKKKDDINEAQEMVEYYRYRKFEADQNGYLLDEYKFHDSLKYWKQYLKKIVEEQKFLKSSLKKLKVAKPSKKHSRKEVK